MYDLHIFFINLPLQVPRMIVNVVQILPMETLREVQKPTPGCVLQRYKKLNQALKK